MRARRKWQSAFVLATVLVGVSLVTIKGLHSEIQQRKVAFWKLQLERKREIYILDRLQKPQLVTSRAEGINAALRAGQTQQRIAQLTQEMARLSQDENQQEGELLREQRAREEGVAVSGVATRGATVNLGVALPFGYAWPQVTSNFEQLLGRSVPTVVIFRDWQSEFPLKDCREARVRAKTLQITWEPWHFSDPNAIKLSDISAGKHDKYIDAWAQGARGFGGELWIRWGHEFNGNWYPWSLTANGRGPAQYVAAYRHVVDRFRKAGASNVRWVWCFNAESVPSASWNDPLRAYPGDNYVDSVAIDGYNFGTSLSHGRWMSFEEVFAAPYARAVKKLGHKPLMIGEVGCATQGGDKAAWIEGMKRALQTRFSKIEGVVWFEAEKEADWRMTSTPQTLAASRRMWQDPYFRRGEM